MNKNIIASVVIGIVLSAIVLFFAYSIYENIQETKQNTASVDAIVKFINSKIQTPTK